MAEKLGTSAWQIMLLAPLKNDPDTPMVKLGTDAKVIGDRQDV